jgi:hypothetical protein
VSKRSFLAWCTGGGGGATTGEPVIELTGLVRETGGSNSGEILGYSGGGMGVPTELRSKLDVDATTFSENDRGLPGRFGGTGGGGPWTM